MSGSDPEATYSGDPSDSTLDAVRFLIGDIVDGSYELLDAEIEWILSQHSSSIDRAAVAAARQLAARYGTKADKSVGDLSIRYQDRRQFYLELSKSLQNDNNRYLGAALTGISGGGGVDRDPMFWLGMHRKPGNPITDYSTGLTYDST